MTIANIIIDGNQWEISGNISDSYLPYTNTSTPSRSGKSFPVTEAKSKMVTIENIMVSLQDREAVENFFKGCGDNRFTLTVVMGSDECPNSTKTTYDYLNCFVTGDQVHSLFESKISTLEVVYDERVTR